MGHVDTDEVQLLQPIELKSKTDKAKTRDTVS